MRYYAMIPDLDNWSVTGPDYPQIEDIENNEQSEIVASFLSQNFWKHDNNQKDITEPMGFKLSPDAKLTNFLSHVYPDNFLFLDDKALSIFKLFNIGEHVTYRVKVNDHGIIYNYNILSIKPHPDILDWGKCLFIDNAHIQNSEYYKFKEWQHFVYERNYLCKEYHVNLSIIQIIINSDFSSDCFYLGIPMGGNINNLIVNQRLKDALLSNNVTGVSFKPVIPYFEYPTSHEWEKYITEISNNVEYYSDNVFARRDRDRIQPQGKEIKHPNYTRQIKIMIEEAVEKGLSSFDAVTRVQKAARFAIESNPDMPIDDIVIPNI